jgi:HK97 family phage major capsid protein
MSIQDAREKIAKNNGALLGADAALFKSIDNRYQNLRDKGQPHPADLRRLQSEVAKFTQSLVEKPNWSQDADQPVYDGATGWIELLGAEIDVAMIAKNVPGASGAATGWVNAAGNPVHLLAPEEKVADTGHRSGNVGVGDMLAAMLGGTKSPEIKASLSEGTDSAGGYSIPLEVLREFIDKLRAKTQFVQAGARTLLLDGLNTRIMRITADPTAAWRAESAAVTESAPTFDAVDFLPKSLAVLVKVSLELLGDTVNAADALEKALIGSLSVALDQACLFGDGTSNTPVGLFNTSGISTVSMGTNGGTPTTYDDILDAIYAIEAANAGPATAAIMHPRTTRTYRKLKDGQGNPVRLPPGVDGLPMLSTTSVPITQTQGTATNQCSTLLLGDFSQAILGMRQELVISRLDQRYMDNLQVGFIAHLRADVGFAHPESFTKIIGLK